MNPSMGLGGGSCRRRSRKGGGGRHAAQQWSDNAGAALRLNWEHAAAVAFEAEAAFLRGSVWGRMPQPSPMDGFMRLPRRKAASAPCGPNQNERRVSWSGGSCRRRSRKGGGGRYAAQQRSDNAGAALRLNWEHAAAVAFVAEAAFLRGSVWGRMPQPSPMDGFMRLPRRKAASAPRGPNPAAAMKVPRDFAASTMRLNQNERGVSWSGGQGDSRRRWDSASRGRRRAR